MVSAIDLILLGMLQEQRLSAYDLEKTVEKRNISSWINISKTSIYNKVLQYEKKGYVTSETVKNGNMPPKTIYSITEQGKEYLLDGMKQNSKEVFRFFIDYNAILINMNILDKDERKELLINMQKEISAFAVGINENAPQKAQVPIYGDYIIKQQKMLAETMKQWIDELIQEEESV